MNTLRKKLEYLKGVKIRIHGDQVRIVSPNEVIPDGWNPYYQLIVEIGDDYLEVKSYYLKTDEEIPGKGEIIPFSSITSFPVV